MSNNILILPVAIGLLTILMAMPVKVSFSQQQLDEATGNNMNTTQFGTIPNQTSTTIATANETTIEQQQEEQMAALASSLRENLTSGESHVLAITMSRQTDVPVQHERRDTDPLGLIVFPDQTTMSIAKPDYASGEDVTSTLYAGGQLSFQFVNITMEPPDNIDVLFISTDGSDTRIPEVNDDTGEDNEFVIPGGLRHGGTYFVLVRMDWPESGQDTMMGILGKAVVLEEPEQ